LTQPLDGKVAIVTGAGRMRGIGRAIALNLAEDGADVVVTAVRRSPDEYPEAEREASWRSAESVAEEVRATGRRSIAMDVDVTSAEQVATMVQRTVGELGKLDILVNNAGLALVAGKKDLWEVDDDEWHREIAVNLDGTYLC
jgi:3-oxoacyl-[acyl-carrier protein] reductase/meso-butanediol dehydrogenase/(S,S)-butanediol dehydrogenase/diacetyl reductase